MKKKVIAMLICSSVLCLTTACGSRAPETVTDQSKINSKEDRKISAADKSPTTFTEASTESDAAIAETNAEVSTISAEELKDETFTVPTEAESMSNVYGKTEVGDILVNDYVFEQDKSADYAVFSTSSKDAEAFLRENGAVDYGLLGESGKSGNYDYTGRFAYPEVKTSKRLQNLYLEYRSDKSAHYVFDDEEENQGVIGIYLGHDNYQLCSDPSAHVDGIVDFTEFATLRTPDGEDVLVWVRDTAAKDKFAVYYYKLGAFSVKVQRNMNDELYTPEEFQEIIDNIILQ